MRNQDRPKLESHRRMYSGQIVQAVDTIRYQVLAYGPDYRKGLLDLWDARIRVGRSVRSAAEKRGTKP